MRKTLLFLIFSFLSWCSLAQQRAVHGKVTSADDGTGQPGVNVVVKGTPRGTVTDANGQYTIDAAPDDILVFTFIGMLPQEITVGTRELIDVAMAADIRELSEVVVVGYGTEQKRLMTEAVGVVKSDAIKDLPVPTVDGVLQGQTTGVQVSQNSGTPGGAMSVRIRGNTSLSGSGQPLYVIDGIPIITGDYAQIGYEGQGINALSDLNPNDIESMSVLKDAAASAVYGARASNGVVLITTKRGKTGQSSVNFNMYKGFQQVWNRLDMLNAAQWRDYRKDLTGVELPDNGVDVDWQDQIFRTAPMSNYELSTTGGNDKTKFFISGNYFDQDGIILSTAFKRLNGRINVDHKINDRLSVGTSIGLTYSKSNRVEGDASLHGILPNGISTPAVISVYNADGSYNQSGPYSNAVSIANEATNENFTYRTLGNVFGEYRILPGLTVTSKWGVDFYNLREHAFEFNTVQGQKYNGLGFETYTNVLNIVSNNMLRYETSFGQHNLDVVAGYSFEKKETRSSYMRGQDYTDENLQYINSAATKVDVTANALDHGLRSYFSRLNYNYHGRYMVSLSGRIDGSSNFGPNHKNGFFPAASVAWRIGEEDFIKDNLSVISEFKVRASYGLLGNEDLTPFSYQAMYGTASYHGAPAIYPSQIPNPDLKWESTAQFDVGLDAGLFEDRVTVSFDYYNKQTKDLLQAAPVEPSSGFSSAYQNVGELENKGIEISLGYNNRFGDLQWTSRLNVSGNRNKVTKLYGGQPLDAGRGGNRIMERQPIGVFYNFKSLGVDPSTGDIVFADTNHDGEITTDDRTVVGNPNPKFIGGFTNTFNYKNFDLSVFLQWSYGNDVFNGSRLYLESLQRGDNQTTAVLRRWKKPGDITDVPRATSDPVAAANNVRVSSRFVEDGSYLRVKNVTLGYTLRRKFSDKIMLSSIRVYASAQNLFTFTNYGGLDPEVNYSGNDVSVVGTDFFTFPQARAITFGLNLKF
ncbi:TonB-linked outer membrane protein, SusC/RagA family [Chryseolinea serpens]|uniref:TonB-linked outer membrane protein, SusC/RagA family n=1 Tax=Chryseolinea serpens TaxID=947013 RepID=A0A1M5JI82_9BACT|nr:TonB-dependent receptor [Chryseolinea serpens]SHG40257.1 TonB-linked outer membrane protein, SusC/RagA family [Chryseolinea serpens]